MSIYDLNDIEARVVKINKDNGWSDDMPEGGPELTHWLITKLALGITELSEGIEEVRKGHAPGATYYSYPPVPASLAVEFSSGQEAQEHWESTQAGKPEGLPSELADTVIRIVHLCALLKIDLPAIIDEKLTYNASRGFRHGNKAA